MSDDDRQQVIDAEVVPEGAPAGQALERRDQPGESNLFRTDDPVEVLAKATPVADALKRLVDQRGLIQNIKGKDHPRVEAWQTLGAMLGVTAVCVHTEPIQDRHGKAAYLATVEARHRGVVVGRADAMCSTSESRWKTADDYAIRSMAQTRATSKALKGPLGWVMQLAGYETTPAEEMPADDGRDQAASDVPADRPPDPPASDNTETIDPAWANQVIDKVRDKGLSLTDATALLAGVGDPACKRAVDTGQMLTGEGLERRIAFLSPDQARQIETELA